MKEMDKKMFRYTAGVAIACMEDDRPDRSGTISKEEVRDYLSGVLELIFSPAGVAVNVEPLSYPSSSKFPVIIRLKDLGCRLLWFYPDMPMNALADEITGVLCDIAPDAANIPA